MSQIKYRVFESISSNNTISRQQLDELRLQPSILQEKLSVDWQYINQLENLLWNLDKFVKYCILESKQVEHWLQWLDFANINIGNIANVSLHIVIYSLSNVSRSWRQNLVDESLMLIILSNLEMTQALRESLVLNETSSNINKWECIRISTVDLVQLFMHHHSSYLWTFHNLNNSLNVCLPSKLNSVDRCQRLLDNLDFTHQTCRASKDRELEVFKLSHGVWDGQVITKLNECLSIWPWCKCQAI